MIEGVIFTPLTIIETEGGDVLHAMKNNDSGFLGFGESYFSAINFDAIKGWKLHHEMVLNLVVPVGSIKFVVFDNREGSKTHGKFGSYIVSRENYGRLTVPPELWLAFKGLGFKESLLLNIASIPHDPKESKTKKLNEIYYDWS